MHRSIDELQNRAAIYSNIDLANLLVSLSWVIFHVVGLCISISTHDRLIGHIDLY